MLAEREAIVNPKTGRAVKVYRTIKSADGDRIVSVVSVKDFEDITGVRLCTEHTGKMDGLQSLSTDVKHNALCKAHMDAVNKEGVPSVCSKCYAFAMAELYTALGEKNAKNGEILKSRELEIVPLLGVLFFRFEAFGDLETKTQFINYLNIAKAKPSVKCALWTKNPFICNRVFKDGAIKPANLNIGVSSLFLDTPAVLPMWEYFIDFYFTVYTADYLKDHREIKINCGGLSCLACGRCYTYNKSRNGKGAVMIVNELLKQDKTKAKKYGIDALYD